MDKKPRLLFKMDIPFLRNWLLHLLIILFVFFWIAMAISPLDRTIWYMENFILVSTIVALALTYRKFSFTNASYLLMFIFFCLHTYGAHYTYQNTPFDMWLKSSFQTNRSYF